MPAIQRVGVDAQVNGHSHSHDLDDDHHHEHHSHSIQDVNDDILTHEDGQFRPLVIMEISEKTTNETRRWMMERIEAPEEKDGAGKGNRFLPFFLFLPVFALKAVDTIGNCQRLAFTVGVSQHMHKITNLCEFELNRSLNLIIKNLQDLQDNNEEEKTPLSHEIVCV